MNTKKHLQAGSLISATVYGFNLDKRDLEIEDYDFFVPKREISFSEGFRLKIVNPDIAEVTQASIYLVKPPFTSIENALKKTVSVRKDIAEVAQEENHFVIKIHKQFKVSEKLAALLLLKYRVALKGNGPRLFYCGSVQPSDYSKMKDYLNIKNVNKKVKMVVFSCRPFEGWVFNASELIAFPNGKLSIYDRVQRFIYDFDINIGFEEWERANYFGIFVQ